MVLCFFHLPTNIVTPKKLSMVDVHPTKYANAISIHRKNDRKYCAMA